MDATPPRPDTALLDALGSSPPVRARQLLEQWLLERVAAFLDFGDAGELHARDRFTDLGFDSLRAVDFARELEAALLLPLRSTLLFDRPTPEALTDHLARALGVADGTQQHSARRDTETAGHAAGAIDSGAGAHADRSPEELRLLLARAEAKLASEEARRREPIAIVGLGCRFPGGSDDPEAYWRMLLDGRDATCDVPADRWDAEAWYDPDPATPGRMNTKRGGFLGRVDLFDAGFFSISPREATELDPQQRLLLEVTWETLEHAAVSPELLYGTRTGVFLGLRDAEYFDAAGGVAPDSARGIAPEDYGAYFGTGNALSTAAGRLAFTLGLTGPCLSVDTACSSSLLAVHLALQSLRRGECDAALAGGVTLMLDPRTTLGLSQASMMAPDGRCKTFDASANGYVRAEGCGMLLLKPLSTARADGDRILAVLRGSATNQDGASGGLTVPNGPAQEAVLRAALGDADVQPYEVGYVEAHGTGTSLGDPIEVGALDGVFGEFRPHGEPLVVGSVKTNLGHMETASGAASLIKLVLALDKGRIPRHLHLTEPNPHIDWVHSVVEVATETRDWPRTDTPRIAGTSSFGFSGSNVHVVVAEAPLEDARSSEEARPAELLCLSAREPAALEELARAWSDTAGAEPAPALEDLSWTAARGRATFSERLAVVAGDAAELAATLSRGTQASGPSVALGHGVRRAPRVAFLFTGQGSQYAGMGRELYAASPVFRSALERCAEALEPYLEPPLLSLLWGADAARLDETQFTQPALFALGCALAETWRALGLTPAAVLGHSVGEITAACVAGALTLEDGARLAAERGRLMAELAPPGAMLAAFASEAALWPFLKEIDASGRTLSVAAANGPASTTLSGTPERIAELATALSDAGVRTKTLAVSRAFHSPLLEPVLPAFRAVLGELTFHTPELPGFSCLEPGPAEALWTDPEAWARHVLEPVRFAEGVRALAASGVDVFLELGPGPILTGLARACLDSAVQETAVWASGPRRAGAEIDEDATGEWRMFLESTGRLWTAGAPLALRELFAGRDPRPLHAPTYPFQRKRYWLEPRAVAPNGSVRPGNANAHPLLGERLDLAPETSGSPELHESFAPQRSVYEAQLGRDSWMHEHVVYERAVIPGAGWLECLLAAAAAEFGTPRVAVEHVAFQAPRALGEEPTRLQTSFQRELAGTDGAATVRVHGRGGADASWTLHAGGRALALPDERLTESGPEPLNLELVRATCPELLDIDAFYALIRDAGLEYGPTFACLRELHRGPDQVLARVEVPADAAGAKDAERCVLHPGLSDACFQAAAAFLSERLKEETFLPVGVDRVEVLEPPGLTTWCRARMAPTHVSAPASRERVAALDLDLHGDDGRLQVRIRGLRVAVVSRAALLRAAGGVREWLHHVRWREAERANATGSTEPDGSAVATEWIVAHDSQQVDEAERLQAAFAARDARVQTIAAQPDALRSALADHGVEREIAGIVLLATGPASASELCSAALTCIHELTGAQLATTPRLVLVTRGAQDDHALGRGATTPPHADAAALWALGATVALEHPELRCLRVDLDPAGPASRDPEEAAALATELLATDVDPAEDGIALRDGARFVCRLTPGARSADALELPVAATTTRGDQTWGLTARGNGGLDRLALEALPRRAPAAGEVEVEVRAAGLNFKDVLIALGRVEREETSTPLGVECAGVVTRLGPGVDDLRIGDRVWASPDGALAGHALALRHTVQRLPERLGFADAAALPIVALTALHGLEHLAQLAPGERVLIHAGAGGVGQAAIAVATRLGCEVFTTASAAKRDWLHARGVRHVFDSRSESWAADLRAATGGAGVDVVLNSLSGEHIPLGLDAVTPGGRFVEIGKLGTWSAAEVAARRPDVAYHQFDLTELKRAEPQHWAALMAELARRVEAGELAPLPVTLYELTDARRAFSFAAAAKHRGKLVVRTPRLDPFGAASRVASRVASHGLGGHEPRAEGTLLITGGLGALGLALAGRAVERGARRLVLAGRSAPGSDAARAVDELRALGAEVRTVQLDAADEAAVSALVAELDAAGTPLTGIAHAAGVLDDGVLANQTAERFARVLAPKVDGGWNLHRATAHLDLDLFLLFSSMVSVLGSPGQAPYAAANAFLDGLAAHRRALGLAATSLAFGPWAEAGMAADREERNRKRFAEGGLVPMVPELALDALERALRLDLTHALVLDVRWPKFLGQYTTTPPRLLADLGDAERSGERGAAPQVAPRRDVLAELVAVAPEARRALLDTYLAEELARVLGADDPTALDTEREFLDYGVDSLLAVDLRNRLETTLGASLSATLLFDHPTLAALAAHLEAEVLGASPIESELDEALLAEIEGLSDEEALRLLAAGDGE